MNCSFINNTGLTEHNSFPHLLQTISADMENETNMIEHSKYYSDMEFMNMYQPNMSEITILNLNCGSLNAKFDQLKLFLATVDPMSHVTCITLQETWCNEFTDMTQFNIAGYTMITKFKCTEVSEHGGLVIYVNNDFSFTEITGNQSLIHETLGIEIWLKNSRNNHKFTIFSVYRVPTGITEDLLTFIQKFTELLELVQNKRAYICCDTNIDLLQIHKKTHFSTFYENITQNGFLPMITLPTRLGGNTLIDNIFTNNIGKPHINGIFKGKISDHQMAFCILENKNKRNNTFNP